MLPATSNRRASHTGVADDVRKAPEPGVAPEVAGVLGNLLAPDPGPRKSTDELKRIALARVAEYARARGWEAPESARVNAESAVSGTRANGISILRGTGRITAQP
jgi:hypothetical protein